MALRVIAGSQKGRSLKAVPGRGTRPTTDKVKEAMFNIIGPYFTGGYGLDLFAGSGALGIEGLSRGLEHVIFCDVSRKALATIKENIERCGFKERAEVYRADWKKILHLMTERKEKFSVIWLDPPYEQHVYIKVLEKIASSELLAPDGVIVCEHAATLTLPDQIGMFERWKYAEYGTIAISIFIENSKEE